MKPDPEWFQIISELLVDLSAGWFSAAFIVPNFAGLTAPSDFGVLTMDIVFGILCSVTALKFRKLAKKI